MTVTDALAEAIESLNAVNEFLTEWVGHQREINEQLAEVAEALGAPRQRPELRLLESENDG
jgi:hypothetical protein